MNKNTKSIAIIGAGASGLVAAYAAVEYGCKNMILIEKNPKVGKKILSTGNGRCNLSNTDISEKKYTGDTEYLSYCDKNFDTVSFFENIGLMTKADDSGRIYPYSNTASSVLDALRFCVDNKYMTVKTDFDIEEVCKKGKFFEIKSNNEIIYADELIIACGGKATSNIVGDRSGYAFAKKFGHSFTELYPALAPLKTSEPIIKALKGLRANCRADIYINSEFVRSEKGEVQFTENALSGICIFDLSALAALNIKDTVVSLDLAPDILPQELTDFVLKSKEIKAKLPAEELLTGLLHKRLGQQIIKSCFDKPLNTPCSEINKSVINEICKKIKGFKFKVSGVSSWDNAQVTCGGIPCNEIKNSFESKFIDGLFFCGEILNICGKCGGYNLDFAWKSGYTAGKNAALKLKGSNDDKNQ